MSIIKKTVSLGLLTSIFSISGVLAQNVPNLDSGQPSHIYPFVAFKTSEIISKSKFMSEDPNALMNIFEIQKLNLHTGGRSKVQPWTSTYWPLKKGIIADAYTDKTYNVFGTETSLNLAKELNFQRNYRKFLKRKKQVHEKIDKLNDEELAMLAPSEKYDLLLGDKTFDLTNKVWHYSKKWANEKENAFISGTPDVIGGGAYDYAQEMLQNGWYPTLEKAMIAAMSTKGGLVEHLAQKMAEDNQYSDIFSALPEARERAQKEAKNYVLKAQSGDVKSWEGICHGWSTAAGIVPRPKHAVDIKLADGRNLKFYPEDLKALASYMWANSLVQDGRWQDDQGNYHGGGILMEGLRCNEFMPRKDEFGRYYDYSKDNDSKEHQPRCVGVHPALWHLGLVNIVGKQQRSIVVERKVKMAVDNHPLSAYKMEYFNPNTGEYSNLQDAMVAIDENDQFFGFRNKDAKFIVGVKTIMTYMDWTTPKRAQTDSPEDDKTKDVPMLYDLEIDENHNIVGGQWRVVETGKPSLEKKLRTQPDFFWAVTKDWKQFFNPNTQVSKWTDMTKQPPKDWLAAAKGAHSFLYFKNPSLGNTTRCDFVNKKDKKDELKVPCNHVVEKPQPFLNVVDSLIELSRE